MKEAWHEAMLVRIMYVCVCVYVCMYVCMGDVSRSVGKKKMGDGKLT